MKLRAKFLILLNFSILSFVNAFSQIIKKIVLDSTDFYGGHFIVVEPDSKDTIASRGTF